MCSPSPGRLDPKEMLLFVVRDEARRESCTLSTVYTNQATKKEASQRHLLGQSCRHF